MYGIFGMPAKEVEISKKFQDEYGKKILVDASKNGWVITYADFSTESAVISDTAEENIKKAIDHLKSIMKVT